MARRKRYRRKKTLVERLKQLLIFAVIAVPALAFGSKFWIEYKIEDFLADAADSAAPFGELRHLGVSVWFDGSVKIENLSFYPRSGTPAPPFISSSIKTQTPGYLYLLGVGREGFPDRMRFEIDGVRMDLGVGGASISGNPIEALGCSDDPVFSSAELSAMGIDPRGDIVFSYVLDRATQLVTIALQQTVPGAASQDLDLTFKIDNLDSLLNPLPTSQPPSFLLASASLQLEAEAFIAKRNAYCAAQSDIPAEGVAAQNVNAMVEVLAEERVRPNRVLGDHYTVFMRRGREWTLTASPEPPLDLASLAGEDMSMRAVIDRLNIRSQIANGLSEPVKLDRVRVPENLFTKESGDGVQVPPTVPLKWQDFDQAGLRADPNLLVQVTTVNGQTYYGYVEETQEESVVILGEVQGGEAKLPIRREQISFVRALLPEPAPTDDES